MKARQLVDEVLRGRRIDEVLEQDVEPEVGDGPLDADVPRPRSKFGLTAKEALEAIAEQGRTFTQEESNYKQPGDNPREVCGNCRFFLRDETSVIGKCQVVDGAIAWFGTSDLFIDSAEESEAAFAQAEEMGEDMVSYASSEEY